MTNAEIIQTIKDHDILRGLADRGSDATIADAIRGFVAPVHDGRRTKERDILRLFGPTRAEAILAALGSAYPAVARNLQDDGLDLSVAAVAGPFLLGLVQRGVVTVDEVGALRTDHLTSVSISAGRVSEALLTLRPDGKALPIDWSLV